MRNETRNQMFDSRLLVSTSSERMLGSFFLRSVLVWFAYALVMIISNFFVFVHIVDRDQHIEI